MIVFGSKEDGKRIAQAIPRQFNPEVDPVISNVKDGKLLGGVIFDGYTGAAIFMHQAGFDKHWMSRDLLWACFDYAFVQLKCNVVAGTIPSKRLDLLALNQRLGFKVTGKIEDAYPDCDLLVMTMKRGDCRWLKLKPRHIKAGDR